MLMPDSLRSRRSAGKVILLDKYIHVSGQRSLWSFFSGASHCLKQVLGNVVPTDILLSTFLVVVVACCCSKDCGFLMSSDQHLCFENFKAIPCFLLGVPLWTPSQHHSCTRLFRVPPVALHMSRYMCRS